MQAPSATLARPLDVPSLDEEIIHVTLPAYDARGVLCGAFPVPKGGLLPIELRQVVTVGAKTKHYEVTEERWARTIVEYRR